MIKCQEAKSKNDLQVTDTYSKQLITYKKKEITTENTFKYDNGKTVTPSSLWPIKIASPAIDLTVCGESNHSQICLSPETIQMCGDLTNDCNDFSSKSIKEDIAANVTNMF